MDAIGADYNNPSIQMVGKYILPITKQNRINFVYQSTLPTSCPCFSRI